MIYDTEIGVKILIFVLLHPSSARTKSGNISKLSSYLGGDDDRFGTITDNKIADKVTYKICGFIHTL